MLTSALDQGIRCDEPRCPAIPLVFVIKGSATLGFCGHHFHDREPDLFVAGWQIGADLRPELRRAEARLI